MTTPSTASCCAHQVETRTEPATEIGDLRAQLVDARRRVGEAAREVGAAAVATGTAPFGAGDVRVSPKDRYRAMVDEFGETSREAGTCGMHVHVGIASREEGIGIIDRMRPWLPLVLALSVNSPYAEGRDSGYASWRSQVWCRWPTAGATELFGDPATYDALVADLMAAGAASDPGMVYFEARLAADVADGRGARRRRVHRPRRRRRRRRRRAGDRRHRGGRVGGRHPLLAPGAASC